MAVYLITGGAGFIGSHLADALVARGDTVRIYDNFSTGKRANLSQLRDQVEVFEASVTDSATLAKAMRGVDYVLHQAALPSVPRSIQDPLESHEAAATGTLKVLLAAHEARVKRVVYAGSSSAYGDIEGEFKQEDMSPAPLSPYAAVKLAGENYCRVFYHTYGLQTVVLRYFNVFGPRQDPTSQYSAVIPLFISKMIDDVRPTIYGDGTQSRDFTFIDNVVQGNLLACEADKAAGQVINLACGQSITLRNLVDLLNRMLNKQIEPYFVSPRVGDIWRSQADIDKARRLLNYEPKVSFEDGLKRTLEWFQSDATSYS
jgi:UDP-glucose 4-epimerase